MAGRWLRSHRAGMALALGLLLVFVGALPPGAHAAGGPQSGEFGDPASDYMKYTFSGADFSGDPGGDFLYEGVSTGNKFSLSGTMSVTRKPGTKSYVTMKASLGDKSASWPPPGEDSTVTGRSVQLPFNLSFTIPRGYSAGYVSGEVTLSVCGDWVCGGYAVRFTIKVPEESTSGRGSTGGTSPDDGSSGDAKAGGSGGITWGDAGGGLAAVAAVAIAIAAAAAKKPDGGELDPTTPVGYVLDLSTRRIEFAAPKSSLWLTATVYDVYPDGRAEVSPGAEISFSPPPGVGVSPATGMASVNAVVSHEGEIAPVSTLVVSASTAGGTHQDAVEIVAAVPKASLSLSFDPGEKSTLAAWGGDSVVLVGRVVFAEGASPDVVDAARASIDFASGSEWLDMSEAVDWGPDGRAVRIMASQPNPEHPVQPPESATVTCTATVADTELSQVASIALAPNPTIDAAPDTVHFAADSGESAEVRAWIESGGGLTWSFRTEWRDGSEPLAEVAQTDEPPSAVTLELTEASGGQLDPSHPEQAATLRIIATASDAAEEIELERYVKVIVMQEGLFIVRTGRDEDGSFHVLADGSATPAEVDFQVFARDAEGKIRAQPSLAEALEFEHTSDDGSRARNAAEVGNLSWAPGGTRSSNNPATTWRFTVERQIPADVPVLHVPLEVSVPGMASDEKYVKELIIGLRASRDAPGGPDWQRELARCQRVIYDFVPVAYHARMMSILDRRSRALGADGLAEMRHQIWGIAQDLTLGEGGQGYLEEGKWAGRIETVLEYAEWAGNVAFHGATAHFLPFYHALAAAQVKQLVVSAIQAYEDGISPGDWLWQNVSSVPWILEGQLIDVDKFTKLTGNDRAKAWALFVGYHFFKSYMYDGRTFTDSLIEAGRQARDEAIASWIGAGLRTRAAPRMPEVQLPGRRTAPPGTPPQGPSTARKPGPERVARPGPDARKQKAPVTAPDRAPEFEAPTAKGRADKMSEAIKNNTKQGPRGPEIDVETMEKIMRDPDAARELKKNKEAWEAYDRARQKVYGKRKEQLEKWIEENVPGAGSQKIEVRPVGHPDGVDLDYRAGIVRKNPVTGKEEFIEIDPKHWEPKSNEIFGELTGKPADVPADKWAADRQQLATSQHHSQASPDMADQGWVRDPATGRMVRTQVTPNVDLVKKGEATLIDPDALGKTYETKVADSYHAGAPLDGYKQAQKAVQSLEGHADPDGTQHPGIRDGYRSQEYKVNDPPPAMKKGMQIVDDVVAGRKTPAEGDAALREAGLGNDLPGFMEKVSGEFAKFKLAKK